MHLRAGKPAPLIPGNDAVRSALSSTLVSNLAAGEKPYEIRDARLKGLLLRVQPSGVKTYYVEYARGRRIKLGRADALTPSQARDQAKSVLADSYSGKDPIEARRKARAHSLGSFIDAHYALWDTEHLRTADSTLARLRSSFGELLDKKLDEITPWLVEKWRTAKLKAGAKATTVNRDLDDLKSSLGKAVLWGLIDENPISGVKRSRVDQNRPVRFLTQDEEEQLREALAARELEIRRARLSANRWRRDRGYPLLGDLRSAGFADHLKPMVLLSLNTGIRKGELFGLTWSDVDFDLAQITITGTSAKSGRTRHIPLNAEALGILEQWKRQNCVSDGLVFPSRDGTPFNNVRRSWTRVLKMAGIKRFRWHDLRHSFASRLVMAGVDLNTVRELLGHADYQMTLRYAHLAPEHKAQAVARLVKAV